MMTCIRQASLPMRTVPIVTLVAVIAGASLLPFAAHAQDGAGRQASPPGAASSAAAGRADLEPAVNTSATAAVPAPRASPAQGDAPASPARKPAANVAAGGQPARKSGPRALDRLELESTQITGNRELPKVLYIVPWKRPELGDLLGKPANSLLDEVLAPVDRDVFQRENRYYDALAEAGRGGVREGGAGGGSRGAAGAPAEGGRSVGDEK